MASSIPEKRRSGLARGVVVVAALVAVAAVVFFLTRDGTDSFSSSRKPGGPIAVAQPASRPPARRPADESYVGSAKCAECHDEIAETYAEHTMSYSIAEVPDDRGVETVEEAELRPGGVCVYRVRKDEKGWWHAEAAIDEKGEQIYEQWFPISLAIGSGTRGRSYAVERDGILFRSPISWYSGAGKWDLSPGYQPDDERRFHSRITDECLACHAGRVSDLPDTKQRFGTPVVLEAAIGCERCHGAGKAHVEYQEADDPTGDDPILLLSSLEADRQNALCAQCHLVGASRIPRYGYSTWDFLPGDRLDEVFITFVHLGDTVYNPTKAVSQVEQMYSSRCFEASGRKLLCTTCHNPHELIPEEEKPAWYRQQCLTCHEETSCELELAERKRRHPDDACTRCHMPTVSEINVAHTVQTDHRIVRRPGQAPRVPDWTARFGLAFFDHCDRDLPPWEFKRALGLAVDADLAVHYDPARDVEMQKMLESILTKVPDDPDVLMALGRGAMRKNDLNAAANYFRRGLRYHPNHEGFLGGMAMVYAEKNQGAKALEMINRYVTINRWDADIWALCADTLKKMGMRNEAFAAMEKALELNPRLPNGREWMIQFCQETRRHKDLRRHLDIWKRLQKKPPSQ